MFVHFFLVLKKNFFKKTFNLIICNYLWLLGLALAQTRLLLDLAPVRPRRHMGLALIDSRQRLAFVSPVLGTKATNLILGIALPNPVFGSGSICQTQHVGLADGGKPNVQGWQYARPKCNLGLALAKHKSQVQRVLPKLVA